MGRLALDVQSVTVECIARVAVDMCGRYYINIGNGREARDRRPCGAYFFPGLLLAVGVPANWDEPTAGLKVPKKNIVPDGKARTTQQVCASTPLVSKLSICTDRNSCEYSNTTVHAGTYVLHSRYVLRPHEESKSHPHHHTHTPEPSRNPGPASV